MCDVCVCVRVFPSLSFLSGPLSIFLFLSLSLFLSFSPPPTPPLSLAPGARGNTHLGPDKLLLRVACTDFSSRRESVRIETNVHSQVQEATRIWVPTDELRVFRPTSSGFEPPRAERSEILSNTSRGKFVLREVNSLKFCLEPVLREVNSL